MYFQQSKRITSRSSGPSKASLLPSAELARYVTRPLSMPPPTSPLPSASPGRSSFGRSAPRTPSPCRGMERLPRLGSGASSSLCIQGRGRRLHRTRGICIVRSFHSPSHNPLVKRTRNTRPSFSLLPVAAPAYRCVIRTAESRPVAAKSIRLLHVSRSASAALVE